MSTNAQSAQKWLKEANPAIEQVNEMLRKLEERIENWQGDDDGIQGSIEAVDVLHAHIESIQQPKADDASSEMPPLDASALIPDKQPIELTEDIKLQTFAALKAQLDKRLE
jgi:hypothetical protein